MQGEQMAHGFAVMRLPPPPPHPRATPFASHQLYEQKAASQVFDHGLTARLRDASGHAKVGIRRAAPRVRQEVVPLLEQEALVHRLLLRVLGESKEVLEIDGLVAAHEALEADPAARQPRKSLHLRKRLHLHPHGHRKVRAINRRHEEVLGLKLSAQPVLLDRLDRVRVRRPVRPRRGRLLGRPVLSVHGSCAAPPPRPKRRRKPPQEGVKIRNIFRF